MTITGGSCVCKFLHSKVTLYSSLSMMYSLEGSHLHSLCVRNGAWAPSSWGWRIYINYSAFFFTKNWSLLHHLLIYSIIILIWTHWYLFYTLCYSLMILCLSILPKLFQHCPFGAPVPFNVCVMLAVGFCRCSSSEWNDSLLFLGCWDFFLSRIDVEFYQMLFLHQLIWSCGIFSLEY